MNSLELDSPEDRYSVTLSTFLKFVKLYKFKLISLRPIFVKEFNSAVLLENLVHQKTGTASHCRHFSNFVKL